MNLEHIVAIASKDLLEVRQNTSAWAAMVILPLIFVVAFPLAILLLPSNPQLAGEMAADPDLVMFIEGLPPSMSQHLVGLDVSQQMVVILIGFFLAPFLLIMPLMCSTIIAAESFAGERERKTIEALLYTPTSDRDLFLGKVLAAFVPSVLLTWLSFAVYTLVVNTVGFSFMGRIWFPIPTWWPLMFWVAPALSALGIGASVIISAKTKTFMGAYQLSGSLVIVVLALIIGQVSGVVYLTVGVGLLTGLVLWIAAAILMTLGARTFTRSILLLN